MRPRNTLLLLLVLVGLGAYLYWVELPHQKSQAEQILIDSKPKFATQPEGYRMLAEFYFLTRDLDKAAAEYGCKFDAAGNPTECGAATINNTTGEIDVAVVN